MESLLELSKKYPNININKIYRYSGHGGSVFHKKTLLKTFENESVTVDILSNWKKYNLHSNICDDYLFSILIILNNGTVGPYNGHCDAYGNVINENIHVQHQYKKWYGMELPEELQTLIKK
jgi:hypothetical protein